MDTFEGRLSEVWDNYNDCGQHETTKDEMYDFIRSEIQAVADELWGLAELPTKTSDAHREQVMISSLSQIMNKLAQIKKEYNLEEK